MNLFECSWKEKWDYYERVFDTNLGKSKTVKIDGTFEWYEQNSKGTYSYILDDDIKLVKKLGTGKNAQGHFGITNPIYRNIKDHYWNQDKYIKNPKVWYLDIETRVNVVSKGFPVPEKALEEVTLIQIFDNIAKAMIVIGSRPWKHEADYEFDYQVKYIQVKDEIELFQTYIKIFRKLDPLIIYAWNGSGFDFPYLYNRMKNLGLNADELSNYGGCTLKTDVFQGKTEFKFSANGHYYIDLLDVYKKFTFGDQASYSLDFTAELVLGKKKVEHDEYNSFDGMYSSEGYIINNEKLDNESDELMRQLQIKRRNFREEFKRRGLELPKNI